MLAPLLLLACWTAQLGATDPPRSSTVQDSHKYYMLSVYQDNVGNTFDDNFIEMQHADVKQG